jgi:hypothetical protein
MHDQEPILRAPAIAAKDAYSSEPLQIVLGEKGQRRSRFGMGALLFFLIAALALVIWIVSVPANALSPGFWGISLASVLFWLAVTQGMMAIGALLRIAHASWRFPLTRLTDIVSLFGIPVIVILLPMLYKMREVVYGPLSATGNGQPIGSAGRLVPLFAFEKVWRTSTPNASFTIDCLFTITAYLAGFFLLWITSRPDFASLRDRAESGRRRTYQRMAGGWIGSEHQWRVMRLCEAFLVVAVVMTFFAAQTVIGWDLELASGIGWDSSIFPFQMNLGALMAGTAMLVLLMTAMRGRLKGSGIVGEKQYDSIGKLLLAFGLLSFYFRWCDYITAWYGHTPQEWALQLDRITHFPILFTIMVIGSMLLPIFANIFAQVRRSPVLLSLMSILILISIWCQRFLDTTPAFGYWSPGAMGVAGILMGLLTLVGIGALFVLTYFVAVPVYSAISWWGMSKWNSRSAVQPLGNAAVTVMVEDPPVWEN